MDNEKRAGGLRGAWKRQSAAQQQAAEKRRLGPALQALKALHSVGTPGSMNAEELERQRRMQDIIGHLAAPMAGLSWEPFSLNGMNAAWMRRKAPHKRRRAILYCHGGGYTSGNLGYSRVLASKLTHVTGCDVLTFEYRLAPEHPYPAAVEGSSDVFGLRRPGRHRGGRQRRRESGAGALPTPARSGTYAAGGAGTHVSLDRYDCLRPFLH